MAQPVNNNNVHIKAEEPDVEGDMNMAELQHNPSSSNANEENLVANGPGGTIQSGGSTTRGLGGDIGGPPGIHGGVDAGIHAPPPVPRKDKNLREFLAAMDEYAPIVSFLIHPSISAVVMVRAELSANYVVMSRSRMQLQITTLPSLDSPQMTFD